MSTPTPPTPPEPVGFETAPKLPADYGIAVGTEWIDDDEGEVITVTGIDDPATMYPIAFRWNDGHEGADDVEGFCASFRPRDWTAIATSEASLRAESASLRERVTRAEALLRRVDDLADTTFAEHVHATQATRFNCNCPYCAVRAFLASTEPDGASETKETP